MSSKADLSWTLVNNIGRAVIKKWTVKFEGIEILSIDNFDVFACYRDLWKTKSEKRDAMRQGILSDDGCKANCIKLRINAKDKSASNPLDNATCQRIREQVHYSHRIRSQKLTML